MSNEMRIEYFAQSGVDGSKENLVNFECDSDAQTCDVIHALFHRYVCETVCARAFYCSV